MNSKNLVKLAIIGLVVMFFVAVGSDFMSYSNKEVNLKNSFEASFKERTAFYDKMYKIISQKSQIVVKNDESFRKNINLIMENRKDSPQLVMKWLTETNPNANYSEVSSLYRELSRTVEAQREGFFLQEKVLMDIERQHKDLLKEMPRCIYNVFLDRQPLAYEPIQSSITEDIIKTGKDDNVVLDL